MRNKEYYKDPPKKVINLAQSILMTASLPELHKMVNVEPNLNIQEEKKFFPIVRAFIGKGSIEEQLLKLMIWVGTNLKELPQHSGEDRPLRILRSGTAWCDQAIKVFGFFAFYFIGVETRELAITHCDKVSGHTVGETYYNGKWHLFDAHGNHQAIYRHPIGKYIMSHLEIEKYPEVVIAEQHKWISPHNKIGKVGFYQSVSNVNTYRCYSTYDYMQLPWPLKN